MNKNKLKIKPIQRDSKKNTVDDSRDDLLKMQANLSRLQETTECLFGYLIKKNIIELEEFNAYIVNKFMYQSHKKNTTNSNLQGTICITYYNKESMELIQ